MHIAEFKFEDQIATGLVLFIKKEKCGDFFDVEKLEKSRLFSEYIFGTDNPVEIWSSNFIFFL